MCGILGIIAPIGRSLGIEPAQITAMRDTMSPRGPDGAGSFRTANLAFEHRRLAIRDIAGGAQPWLADDRQTVLVYNGEVYNDVPLRDELTRLGHRFRSKCDTEVVHAAYRQWGAACVEHLRGMFALGVYDFRDDSLFLARDRFGIKPLLFAEVAGTLVFASSIPAILKHPGFVRRPHWPAVSHYLTTFRITLGRATMFEGIQQLLPGECLRWQPGRDAPRIERYWDYPSGEDWSVGFDDAAAQLEDGLRESVSMQLASDVPVGMFLSGGVDSNTIACLVREQSSRPMLGKCGGGDAPSDDFTHARRCAEHVQFDFDEVRLGPNEYHGVWQQMLDAYATPLSTPSDAVIYRLAQRMKESVGVVLGGEGADELLCGYAVQHWGGHDFERSRSLMAQRWMGSSAAELTFRRSLHRQYGRDEFASLTDHYFAANSLIPTAIKPALLREQVWRDVDDDRAMHDAYDQELATSDGDSASRRYSRLLHRVNLEALLARLDSATMLAGLEARVPYTDHRLVEQMFRVPEPHKIDVAEDEPAPWLASAELEQRGSLKSKRILRAVADRMMPAALARRRKASFPTPVPQWVAGPWADWARTRLQTSRFAREVFQSAALEQLAGNLPQVGMRLWPVLNVIEWGDRQFAA